MKSSRNLTPDADKVQSWLPMDLVQNLIELALHEKTGSGEAERLFNQPSGPVGDSRSGGLLKAGADSKLTTWTPGELALPRPEKPIAEWQPAIRYNTPANASDVATQIITDAQRQADEIIHAAEQGAKSVQEQAYQDGWNAALIEMNQHFSTAKSLISETIAWRDELLAQSEPMILELVNVISQKLFGEGFVLDRDTLQQTFNRVLENARSLGDLRVYVNPQDAVELGPYWRELQESITTHRIEIVPSNSISRGGCYVNGQWGSADGRIETQLKAIMQTLTPETDTELTQESAE